ncbi:2-keto-3-deoxygluconate permease [Anaerorhabdus sp.]|uniref:2-keto-3-deoxygluconate permease n=1 Tax=Anaerorhabdus sp. TaxID=1872524 RepID=UPI002FC89266
MKIFDKINKIPAGMMIVPVLIGAIINTLFPNVLLIGDPFSASFYKTGLMSLIGLMLFFTGTQCEIRKMKPVVKKGIPLATFKLISFIILAKLCVHYLPIEGILGIPTIAIVTCIISCNSALYLSLMETYGDEADKANFGLLTIIGMPNIALLILGSSSSAFNSIMAMLIPFLLGIGITALDVRFKEYFKQGISTIVPVAGFAFGTNINLLNLVQSAFTGVLLTIVITIVSIGLAYFFDTIVLRQKGCAAIATCGVSGVSLSLPYLASVINPELAPFVSIATAQCAVALTLTTFIIPFLTKWCYEKKTMIK